MPGNIALERRCKPFKNDVIFHFPEMQRELALQRVFPQLNLSASVFTLSGTVSDPPLVGISANSYSLPDALKRVISQSNPTLLFAVTPDLENHLRITILNTSGTVGTRIIESAISNFQEKLNFNIKFAILTRESISSIDDVTFGAICETLTRLWLESLGYMFLRLERSPVLASTSFSIFDLDFRITSHHEFSLRKASQVSFSTNRKRELLIKGKLKFVDLRELTTELESSTVTEFDTKGRVRLDSLPCSVLPNGSIAYAVEYSKDVPPELLNYWKYVHGIDLVSITSVFKVTFVRGNEDFTLTYPSQCVMIPHTFIEKPLRRAGERADKFEEDLTKYIRMMMDMIRVNHAAHLRD